MNEKELTISAETSTYQLEEDSKITHCWIIQFHKDLEGHRLVCINADEPAFYPECKEIELPKAKAGDSITLELDFFSGGFKGCFDSFWFIEDQERNRIYPEKPYSFAVRAFVK